MTMVSLLPVRKDVWDKIFGLFVDTLTSQKDKYKLSNFIDDFFSPTEKIVFAKRLAACVLIAKGHDYNNVHRILHLSSPTIAKISLKIRYGGEGLKPVIKDILNNQTNQIIWKEIAELFDVPIKGNLKSPDRFKRKLRRIQEINKIKIEL